MSISENISTILHQLQNSSAKLIAVTKTRSLDELQKTYQAGIADFGENRVQEMIEKYELLPKDIRWHQIGHLQTNKVKYIAPFIYLIHSVDSLKLLKEINTQAVKNKRIINCLFQVYIAQEESKFGLDPKEIIEILQHADFKELKNIRIVGLMGMASFTENQDQIKKEFNYLKLFFEELQLNKIGLETDLVEWKELSMGMSSDYLIAAELGSTLVRVGSAIYGPRL